MENKKLETAKRFLSGLEHCYYSLLEFEHQHKIALLDFGIDLYEKLEFMRKYVKILEESSKEE